MHGLCYEVEGVRRRGRPKNTWREVVEKDVGSDILCLADAVDNKVKDTV